jgi:hypothetical protein
MNQNEIHEEINNKLNLGNACQLSDQIFFSSHLLHRSINVNIYKPIIICLLFYINISLGL